ncbi:hypothetical protein GCM10023155_18450 [Bremerella cremea]|uniref:hypothetical protein n=1 Tax=Bremerella cremea TaxID=1031537 RepID=UPI00338CDF16
MEETFRKCDDVLGAGDQKLISPGSAVGTLFAKFKKEASAILFCYISMQVTLTSRAEATHSGVIF